MEIRLYNSLTNKIEPFKTLKENEVSIYVCGPTVYNYIHIGNLRPVVFFDTLRKFLETVGYKVTYVSNFTDVDDKIILKAKEENISEKELTDFYIKAYLDTIHEFNVKDASFNPRVTEYMNQIIKYIDELVKSGNAYVNDNEVFFSVQSINEYGKLSKINLDELKSGARIKENDKKKYSFDFLLWKDTDEGIKWDSPWGKGRPGWHTECCVMIDSIFKGKIDIHGGGSDLKFPHHENEIAQSEAHNHNNIATFWIHNAMMNINGDKMSKSLNNVILAKDALNEFGADVTRLILLNASYRSIINFTDETITSNKAIIEKLNSAYKQANLIMNLNKVTLNGKEDKELLEPFLTALADDMNLPNAITYTLELIKKLNLILRSKEVDFNELSKLYYTLNKIFYILGLHIEPKKIEKEDLNLYEQYLDFKSKKDFENSDRLRQELIKKKIL